MSVNRLRNSARGRATGRRWFAIALALFLIADVALVVWAVTDRGAGDDVTPLAATKTPIETPHETAHTEPMPSQTPTPSATPTTQPDATPPTRVITAVSSDVAWRAQVATCPDGRVSIERSEDSGQTWQASEVAGDMDARSVLRIIATSENEAYAVTLEGEDCHASVVGTYVAGAEWAAYPDRLSGYWYVDPADRATVVTSSGPVDGPCDKVIAIAPRDANDGAVLCANHSIFLTSDAGGSWSDEQMIEGAVDLTPASAGYYVAATGQGRCEGTSLIEIAEGTSTSPRGCVGEKAAAGDVAISALDNTVWIWSGDLVQRSTDGGESWS
ncbi:hypothetical protein [Paramicrobacterium fandaimingii]|uniref:hypothetical protein n=1 Tax=Paramicrobacterium fandaimingii TaxID=2708079 RepID=UPI00141DD0C1|nr:hypothetical protein [Microbacterium fandaimingii]